MGDYNQVKFLTACDEGKNEVASLSYFNINT